MAARGYLAVRYAKFGDVPEHVVSAYMRLVSSGLCGELTPSTPIASRRVRLQTTTTRRASRLVRVGS